MPRVVLGLAQMFVATVAIILVIATGVNPYFVTAASLAAALTVTSLRCFGSNDNRPDSRDRVRPLIC